MTQSGYQIRDLVREAKARWLKPVEVLFILQNYNEDQITHQPVKKPASGSLFLFNKRVFRFFRRDGHNWKKKKDGKSTSEAHEKLKVGTTEALNCYYIHGEQNPKFQRRIYWMLDPAHEHIVLVHYREISEGRHNSGSSSELSGSPFIYSQSPGSHMSQYPGSTSVVGEQYEPYQSPGSIEVTSKAVANSNGMSMLDTLGETGDSRDSSSVEVNETLRMLKQQLSLNDDSFEEIQTFCSENGTSNAVAVSENCLAADGDMELNHQACLQNISDETQDYFWEDMFDNYETSSKTELQNGNLNTCVLQEFGNFEFTAYSPVTNSTHTYPDSFTSAFDQGKMGLNFDEGSSLTISSHQKYTIKEICPEWGHAAETTKVVIVGSFLCDPSEDSWTCMFGDVEVPVQIIQDGVISCQAPPHFPGKVNLCLTSGNRQSCSEIRDFEYRPSSTTCARCNSSQTESSRSRDELLLLARFAQMLLSDSSVQNGELSESGTYVSEISKSDEDSWGHVIEALLFGSWTLASITDWLLQEILKDKLQAWLSSKSQRGYDHLGCCSLSKKEQGIIHMIAGLGFVWALKPVLCSGVSINFRDINGWTALHWAARFGREKMVAELVASGAYAGAVTDPKPKDPTGRTPASVAATYGHNGLAGYLSEWDVRSHLSSLTLEESELSKGSADVEAENAVNNISYRGLAINDDHLSLKDTLAAVRNTQQAAARIQAAFRAHSFRRRQHNQVVSGIGGIETIDEYSFLSNEIEGLSSASKLAFGNARDYTAALSIQKKYRSWKGRRDYLALRKKIVKIQAHFRGHRVRKQYKVIWAVGILEKVVLRWRRKGVGLRGFRQETEVLDDSEDEDILKVFRKKKVDGAIDEAVSRVLSMVDSPDARKQYRRMLEQYRLAKAEREKTEFEETSFHG